MLPSLTKVPPASTSKVPFPAVNLSIANSVIVVLAELIVKSPGSILLFVFKVRVPGLVQSLVAVSSSKLIIIYSIFELVAKSVAEGLKPVPPISENHAVFMDGLDSVIASE